MTAIMGHMHRYHEQQKDLGNSSRLLERGTTRSQNREEQCRQLDEAERVRVAAEQQQRVARQQRDAQAAAATREAEVADLAREARHRTIQASHPIIK